MKKKIQSIESLASSFFSSFKCFPFMFTHFHLNFLMFLNGSIEFFFHFSEFNSNFTLFFRLCMREIDCITA